MPYKTFDNYKGIYADNNAEDKKYIDPQTGAHFEYFDICNRLNNFA